MPLPLAIRRQIENRIAFLTQERDRLTCDTDNHISDPDMIPDAMRERCARDPNYFHGRPIDGPMLLREMNSARVDLALCWQNPSATRYGPDKDKNSALLRQANQYIADMAVQHPERIYPAGWTDPSALGVDNARAMVDTCVRELGFAIVKLNPAQNAYPIDSNDTFKVVDRIVELGAVPAFHFGPDTPYTPVEGLERLAARYPGHPVIGVHFGGGGGGYVESEEFYHAARDLGLRQTNIHYIESAKRDAHIESDLITYRLAGPEHWRRIFLGSDAPYGRQNWNFGGYRAMFNFLAEGANHTDPRLQKNPNLFDADTVQDFMGRNFADFAATACRRILDRDG